MFLKTSRSDIRALQYVIEELKLENISLCQAINRLEKEFATFKVALLLRLKDLENEV